jgi:hypothetical protein
MVFRTSSIVVLVVGKRRYQTMICHLVDLNDARNFTSVENVVDYKSRYWTSWAMYSCGLGFKSLGRRPPNMTQDSHVTTYALNANARIVAQVPQRCTNPGLQVARATKFWTEAPLFVGLQYGAWLDVTYLAPTLMRWIIDFWIICGPL